MHLLQGSHVRRRQHLPRTVSRCVLILLIAIILFGVLAFRQMSALILAPVVTIFVIVLSGMPILDTLLQHFMPATSDYITKYFLIFFVGALFGAVYQFTGAAESIARTMGCFCGNHFVAPMIMCITGLLTFGGVSGFVVFFVVYPIALQMFKRANLTRRLIPAAISAGCWTGSPSIQNTIAMKSLGTTATAVFLRIRAVFPFSFGNKANPFRFKGF